MIIKVIYRYKENAIVAKYSLMNLGERRTRVYLTSVATFLKV